MENTIDPLDEAAPAPPVRRANGTFAKGSSGNPDGRPPKRTFMHRMPMDNVMAAIEVAEMPVKV
jgi:hypothetical protein